MRADLHLHTTASDGSMSPAEVVRWAKGKGLEIIAVTDHDSVSGVEEARAEAEKLGLKFVAGIELSTYSNCEIHILGYNIDYKNPEFVQDLQAVKAMRRERNLRIGQKLSGLGIALDIDFGAEGLGRMNIARRLVKDGFCKDVPEAFEKYLGNGGLAYCEARRLTPIEAVTLIKRYGGISSVAHPKKYLQDRRLDGLLCGLKQYGLDALEVNYPGHSEQDIVALVRFCKEYRLLQTGGSDFHGDEDKNFVFEMDDNTLNVLRRLSHTSRYHAPCTQTFGKAN